jgi:chromate reductase
MAKVKIAVIVGSNRRDSINAKLAHALARLGSEQAEFNFVSIGDLPLYNQDLEGELPRSVVHFKALFVTPEHNRSIPAFCSRSRDNSGARAEVRE